MNRLLHIHNLRRYCRGAIAGVLSLLSPAQAAKPLYEEQPISYSASTPADAVARLIDDIEAGRTKLEHQPTRGYLDSVLRALEIPPSSQALVFSKTSFQRDHISPQRPH